MTEINQLFDRAAAIRTKGGVDAVVRKRVAEAAQAIDQSGTMQAHLDVAIEAMAALITVLYTTDADGYPANIDRPTGRILVRLPWGSTGWRAWGLRQWEGRCLRRLLVERAGQRRRFAPLFDFSPENDRWYLNLSDYPTAAAALEWLKKDGPKLAEWRTVVLDHREKDMERKRKVIG